jgi:imidazole glycerol-phosphate synthase subunit HisH
MIVIVDYGMGNLRSVQKAFERINIPAKVSSDIADILAAEKLVLPGVGNFEKGINNLKDRNILESLNETVLIKKRPILGICLGMQLMTEFSEEGNCDGLGWINAKTQKFIFEKDGLKIPHMGWNNLYMLNPNPVFSGVEQDKFFYFVHSYYITCKDTNNIISETHYGMKFVSSFRKNNVYGCQFHPEKSHDAGLLLLKNFALLI